MTNTGALQKNVVWAICANIVYPVCQLGILVVLTRLGTSLMVGQFALGLAISTPVFMFTNVNLRAVLTTDAEEEYRFSEYWGTRLTLTALGFLAVVAIVGALGLRADTAWIVLAVALTKATESLSDLFYGLFQRRERLSRVAVSMTLRGLAAVAMTAVGLLLTGKLLLALLFQSAIWLAIFATHDFPFGRRLLAIKPHGFVPPGAESEGAGPDFNFERIWKLSRLALPLGVVMMLLGLNLNMPRYFIEAYFGEEQLGIFSAIAYSMVALQGMVDALGYAIKPKLANLFAERNVKEFRRILAGGVLFIVLAGTAAIAAAMLVGRELLALVYPEIYARHQDLLVALTIGAVIGCFGWLFTYSAMATRNFVGQVPIFGSAMLATAIACAFLVPRHGMYGGGLATILGAFMHLTLAFATIARILRRAEMTVKGRDEEVAVGMTCSYPPAVPPCS